jgi:hypothetical protein
MARRNILQDRDFRRFKGTKKPRNPRLHNASKEAVNSRNTEMAKSRRKQEKTTHNGPRKAYWPDQIFIDEELGYEMYLKDLCYTDGQRALDEQAIHEWYENATWCDRMYDAGPGSFQVDEPSHDGLSLWYRLFYKTYPEPTAEV